MAPSDPDPPTLPGREPDTLVHGGPIVPPDTDDEPREDTRVSSVYAYGEVIGRGGMGEVVLAHDRRIGRDVAIKRLYADTAGGAEVERFMREARIQARLDHPAIVPVYELGRDESGKPYFTMKRLAGVTLAQMLATPGPTRQRLLRAFADVCRAIDFAHTRGVVHRDLKPGNIVLGEFGDVYVLDWGVARVLEDAPAEVVTADLETLEGGPSTTQVLGTPGYMAPEQLERTEVERPADIYALGAILFEILAGEALHSRSEPSATIASTLADTPVSPARRRPDRAIAPELDGLCVAMLARSAETRPTARRVADKVESFLDGDRDFERRRTLAVDLVWSARAALDEGRRSDSMRAAGRALALDPEAPGAAELVTTLMLEPPRNPPAELVEELRRAEADGIRKHARSAIIAYVTVSAFLPIAMWNGIRKWPVVLGVFGSALLLAFAAWQIRRKPERSFAEMMAYALANAVLLVTMSRMAGPFTFVPALACFMTMSTMSYPAFVIRPWALILTMVAAFLTPIALEAVGVLEHTWSMLDGALVNHAHALEMEGRASVTLIIGACVVTFVIAGIQSRRSRAPAGTRSVSSPPRRGTCGSCYRGRVLAIPSRVRSEIQPLGDCGDQVGSASPRSWHPRAIVSGSPSSSSAARSAVRLQAAR
ncbi:MAG: serine/threonine-protein kinase [Kofleriaceae bacterium]